MTRAIAEATKPNARMTLRLIVCSLLVAPLLLATQAASPASSGLVAAYGFDEGSGTVVTDASGNGHSGTVANATWAAVGKYGKALQFNGSSSMVTIPDAADLHLSTAMTLEAWVNPTTVNANWRDVVYKGNDNYYLEATRQPARGRSRALSPAADTARPTAAPTFRPTAGRSRRDLRRRQRPALRQRHPGRLDRPHRGDRHLHQSAQIGGDTIYGQYFAGLIDEVRVYNVALTAAQIQADQTTPITPPGPDQTPPTLLASLTAAASRSARSTCPGRRRPTTSA